MNTTTVTAADLLAAIREVAAERPDYVYTNSRGQRASSTTYIPCDYGHGDRPGCIIGQALHRLGFSLEDLNDFNEFGPVQALFGPSGITVDPVSYEADWLVHVQQAQDRGTSWGEAVKKADRDA